jgi:hypothetical protein
MLCGLLLLVLVSPAAIWAQGAARGPISAPRDPELEKQSFHNLEVAKYYFYKRKPDKNDKDGWARLNKAVIDRLQEILDTNPHFARLDSVYQMLATVYTRDNQPEKALECWSIILKDFPDSEHVAEAKKRLGPTVEAKPKDTKQETKPEKKG